MVSKREREKELAQPDVFHTTMGRVWQRILDMRKELTLIGLAILVIAVGAVLFSVMSNRSEGKAQAMLEEVVADYELFMDGKKLTLPDAENAVSGTKSSEQIVTKLKAVIDAKPRTRAAHMSHYYLAELYFVEKQYNDALTYFVGYEKRLPARSPFRALILSSIGYTHEALDQFNEAADYFEQAAAVEDNPTRAEAYYNAARLFEKASKPEQATQHYKKVVEDFPDSPLVQLAKSKLRKLSS